MDITNLQKDAAPKIWYAQRSASPFAMMCQVGIVAAVPIATIAVYLGRLDLGIFIAALLCGVSEANGRCGISHIGMIAPLHAAERALWLRCTTAYSLGGLATSYLVGIGLAFLGLLAESMSSWLPLGATVVAVAMLLREVGVLRFEPPQCDRQTHKMWFAQFGHVTGAGMWGSHIGLAVATVITHGGLYPLLVLAVAHGTSYGEWVLVAFWVGRVIPLWLAPYLMPYSRDGAEMSASILSSGAAFRTIAVSGLAMIVVICAVQALGISGTS